MSDILNAVTESADLTEAVTPAYNLRWYVIHAYSGMEKVVEKNIVSVLLSRVWSKNLAAF